MNCETIRNAKSDEMIYFLLSAYWEAAQIETVLPEALRSLPITGLDNMKARHWQLLMLLVTEPALPEASRALLKEALQVVHVALGRLYALERAQGRVLQR